MVLLSNDGALPIVPDTGLIAVIGPNADDSRNLFGDDTYPAHIGALGRDAAWRTTRPACLSPGRYRLKAR